MPRPLRILVVDPQDLDVARYAHAFAARGWSVDQARTFVEALDLLEHSFYHAAIVELMLPDLNGTEAWNHFKALQPDLVGILTTHSPSLYESIDITDGSIISYLVKPLDLEAVGSLISAAVHERPQALPPHLDQQLVGLGSLLTILAQADSPQQILATVFAKSSALFKSDWILAYLSQKNGASRATYSYPPPSSEKELSPLQSQFIERSAEKAIASQGFVILDRSTASQEERASLEQVELSALVIIPLTAQNQTFGALAIASCRQEQSFTMIDVELLSAVSRMAALALHNSRLSERLRREAILDASVGTYSSAYLDHMVKFERARRERKYPRRYSMLHLKWERPPAGENTGAGSLKALGVMAELARKQLRSSDVVARYSEGIAVMLAEADDAAAGRVAIRLKQAIETGLEERRDYRPVVTSVVTDWDRPED